MAERTPEQIRETIEYLEQSLVMDRESLEYRVFEDNLNSAALSEEFAEGAKTAKGVERFQGIIDGIKFATGEGELPDIEEMYLISNAMGQSLSPEILSARLGPDQDSMAFMREDDIITGGRS